MNLTDKIFVAGHRGLVGSAIVRRLQIDGYTNILTTTRQELDLRDTLKTIQFFERERPEYVFLAAARVGGIKANIDHPAEFLYDNLVIQNNVIHQSYRFGVKKILFLGSSCIYPCECPQPMKEEYLMTGPLESTNEGYALAKIAGLRMVQYYQKQYGFKGICPMPCNLYGPNDSFDPKNSHVLSANVKRFVDACDEQKDEVTLWGSGIARRELMHVDDLADALLFLIDHWDSPEIINTGWGTDISIKELAELIAKKTGYTGKISWDKSKPDGMLRKCMDVSKLESLGFRPKITLEQGVIQMISEYRHLKAMNL